MHINNSDAQAHASDIAAALRGLKPNRQHHNYQIFTILYPVIIEMLEQKVTQKAILKTLEQHGLKLHPARFKELMANTRNASGKDTHTDVGITASSISEDA